jgi:predicted transcriptional regulator
MRGKEHMRTDKCNGYNKDCVIKVRVSESLKNKIHTIALRTGDTDSGVIRSAIEDAVRKRLT